MAPPSGTRAVRRVRSPLLADLGILFFGFWGFLRQCLKSCGRSAKGQYERESET